jgi:hypothetical protein
VIAISQAAAADAAALMLALAPVGGWMDGRIDTVSLTEVGNICCNVMSSLARWDGWLGSEVNLIVSGH